MGRGLSRAALLPSAHAVNERMEASKSTVFPIIPAEGRGQVAASGVQGVDTLARLERARKAALVRAEANRRRADALEREVLALREQLQGERAAQARLRDQAARLSVALEDATKRKTRYMKALIDLVRAVGPTLVIDVDPGAVARRTANPMPAEFGPVWLDDR